MNIFLSLSYLDPANTSVTDNTTALVECPIKIPLSSWDPSSFNAVAKVSTLLAITLNFVTMPFTIFLNALIIFVVWKNTSLQVERVIVLAYLALADLLVGLICQPLFIARGILQIKTNNTNCAMNTAFFFLESLLVYIASNQLVLVTYERYVAIIHPYQFLQYPTRITVKRLTYVTIALWASIILVTSMYNVVLHHIELPLLYIDISGSVVDAIVVTSMVYWYVRIFIAIRRQTRSVGQQQENANNPHTNQNHKGAITAALLLGCFLVSTIPLVALFFMKEVLDGFVSFSGSVFLSFRQWSWTFIHLGSFVNPIIYGLRVKELRVKCLHVLRLNTNITRE